MRPPLRSLDWVETFLAGPLAEGFTEEAAVAGYRAYTSFLLGHLLLEQFPVVHRLRAQLSQNRSAGEFEEALKELLNRMTLIRNEHLDS